MPKLAERRPQTAGALALVPDDDADALVPDDADDDDLPGWARSLTPNHQLCRGTAHTWDGQGTFYKAGQFYVELCTCRVCSTPESETRRLRMFDRWGGWVETRYSWAEGYTKPSGEEAVSRADMRRLMFAKAPPRPLTTRQRGEIGELFRVADL